jgi:K+-sensing histidine kinase KdpD
VFRRLPFRILQFASALVIVAAITVFYRNIITVNQTTVALTYLLAILAVSTFWGFTVSAFMSVAAMLAFNYFFLPPVGKFTISDPQNWAALVAFLATSLIASQLATRVRREADEAQQRRKENRASLLIQPATAGYWKCDYAPQLNSKSHCGNFRGWSGGTLSGLQTKILSLRRGASFQ